MKLSILLLSGLLSVVTVRAAIVDQNRGATGGTTLTVYYKLSEALVKSNAGEAAKAAKELFDLLDASKRPDRNLPQNPIYSNTELFEKLKVIAGTKDLEKQRVAFQGVSEAFVSALKKEKQARPAYIMYCPMRKAYWISAANIVKNPYYGSAMLTCGSLSETVN